MVCVFNAAPKIWPLSASIIRRPHRAPSSGLFMGRAADSHNRKQIIVLGCLIWSVATAGMGSASAFWSLLTFRLLLGLGAAFSSPASYSMIADLFPPEQRPTANGDMLA